MNKLEFVLMKPTFLQTQVCIITEVNPRVVRAVHRPTCLIESWLATSEKSQSKILKDRS